MPEELPKRWPLVIKPENRGDNTSKDAKLVNAFSERFEDGYWIYSRPGTATYQQPSGGAATGRGTYNWLGDIYAIFGNRLYKNGVAVTGTVGTTAGVYRFIECKGATPKLQLGNGVVAYNYDSSSGLVQITDPDFPSSFVKGWGYLNGTTYVGTPSASIQGSDINTPTDWDPLNVITAYIEPDNGVGLGKQLVYIVFCKQWSTEVFYDAGNSTGSPLGRVEGAKIAYGCGSADSIRSMDDVMFWLSTNKSAAVQVIKLEGLKAEIISTDPVDRLLDGADLSTVYSFTVKKQGHRFYVVTVVSRNLTLAYDLDERMWSQWTDPDGNYFPFVDSVTTSNLTTLLQHESDGYLYTFDEQYATDAGQEITVDVITPNFDGGTQRRKLLNQMTFVADKVSGGVLQVRSNDNDYDEKSWTNFRMVDLDSKYPYLNKNGTFRRRAYHFRYKKHTPLRLRAVELQLELGEL